MERCTSLPWARVLALLAALALLLLLDAQTSWHMLGSLRPRALQHRCPASAASRLGAWGAFIDPCLLPLLHTPDGGSLRSPFTSHEGNGGADIAQFLYAEPEAGVFFFDAAGPVCMVRAFFAAGFYSLGSAGNSPDIPSARLLLEVDGAVVLDASVAELFMERAWGGASAFHPRAYAAAAAAEAEAAAQNDPEGALAGLPRTHTFALERHPGGGLHSGWLLQAPVCASRRLRASLLYPGFKEMYSDPKALLQASADCTATYSLCPVAQYINVNALHFPPGSALPQGWAPFDPRTPPPELPPGPSAASSSSSSSASAPPLTGPRAVWSPARVLQEARMGADKDVTVRSLLRRGDAGGVEIFSSLSGAGAGVVTSLTLDIPRARQLLHSRSVRLVALWDVSLEEGMARLEEGKARRAREAAAAPASPGAPEPFTAPGWSDAEESEEWEGSPAALAAAESAAEAAAAGAWQGGVLEVDLEALLGPESMGEEGARCTLSHQAPTHRCCRKELFLLGEFPGAETEGSGESEGGASADDGQGEAGIYITLPMPYWRSAFILVLWDGKEEEGSFQDGEEVELVSRVTVASGTGGSGSGAGPLYPQGTAGYLQGSVRAFAMVPGMRGNILAQERGVRGSLALLSVYVVAASQNFVEGDLRIWIDGSPSPSVWESGWEDFFDGSHGYNMDLHHCGEALFAYDRVDPPGWGCYNNTHNTVHLYQLRLLMGDAVRFEEGFRVAVEGLPGRLSEGTVRAAALWYSLAAPPLLTTDWLRPSDLWGTAQAAHVVVSGMAASPSHPVLAQALVLGTPPAHSDQLPYTVVSAEDGVGTYTLTSGLPSYGEWRRIEELACFKTHKCRHEGAEGGVVVTGSGALAVKARSWVAFSLRVLPTCQRVLLRRLVDLRYAPQRAALYIDGVRAGMLSSSDRDTPSLLTSWKVDTVALPSALTVGKSALRIALHVLGEDSAVERTYADTTAVDWETGGGHWSEVRWEAVCVPPLDFVEL